MNAPADNIEKSYYSISEAASILGLNASVLRFWDKEFGALSSKKTGSGRRMYTPRDLDRLRIIHYLLKEKNYTVKGAQKVLADKAELVRLRQELTDHVPAAASDSAATPHQPGQPSVDELKHTLLSLRQFLTALRDELDGEPG